MKTIKKFDNFVNEELDLFGRKAKKEKDQLESELRYKKETENDLILSIDEQKSLLKELSDGDVKWTDSYDFKYNGKTGELILQCDINEYYMYLRKGGISGRLIFNINNRETGKHIDIVGDKQSEIYPFALSFLNKIKNKIFKMTDF